MSEIQSRRGFLKTGLMLPAAIYTMTDIVPATPEQIIDLGRQVPIGCERDPILPLTIGGPRSVFAAALLDSSGKVLSVVPLGVERHVLPGDTLRITFNFNVV